MYGCKEKKEEISGDTPIPCPLSKCPEGILLRFLNNGLITFVFNILYLKSLLKMFYLQLPQVGKISSKCYSKYKFYTLLYNNLFIGFERFYGQRIL